MEDIKDSLRALKEQIDMMESERELESYIQSVVVRSLGWNPHNLKECRVAYRITSDREIDIALLNEGYAVVVIEVKSPKSREPIDRKDRLPEYAFRAGAVIALLTNGREWILFYPLMGGVPFDEKWITKRSIDSIEGLAEELSRYLEKENVLSGRAERDAEEAIKRRLRRSEMEKTLSDVIKEILEKPTEILCEEIAETVEERCGLKPEIEDVRRMWSSALKMEREQLLPVSEIPTHPIQRKYSAPKMEKEQLPLSYTKPYLVRIKDDKYSINAWWEVLVVVADWLIDRKVKLPVNERWGHRRVLIGTSPSGMRAPKKLKNGLFIETHASAQQIVRNAEGLLEHCGYDPKIFEVKYRSIGSRS